MRKKEPKRRAYKRRKNCQIIKRRRKSEGRFFIIDQLQGASDSTSKSFVNPVPKKICTTKKAPNPEGKVA